jgi:hypothetical protein
MRLVLISAAMLIAAAPAPVPQKDPVPAATPTGEPVSCISMSSLRSTQVRSDKVIDFIASGGKVYRNELPSACPGLGFEKRFIHRTSLDQYCSLDQITVLQDPPDIPGATCGLGKFQPVKLVK